MADAPTHPIVRDDALDEYLDRTAEQRLESYKALLRIPSISGIPAHAPDCRAAAEFIAADLRGVGMEHVEICETGGHPVVYADWLHAAGKPTVLVYAHYDVQPVDPVDLWDSPPFVPVVKEGRMLARGASDCKCHIAIHARAIEALLATRKSLPVNLKCVFEGEEESSSINLDAWLEANRERLKADFAVISDTSFFEGNLPAITTALRGLVYFQLDVTGSRLDLHSGVYGGAVDNPANALCAIVAALKGSDGRIKVPGFYDDVVELTDLDRRAFAALPFDQEAYREGIGVPAFFGEPGFSILEQLGARPTLDVNGIWGGFEGEGAKTIIPAHAHAKISCRLVAHQEPERIFELISAYIAQVAPRSIRYSFQRLGDGRPSLTPIDHPATQAAARAIGSTFGATPLYIREGGSIPVCASFESILGLDTVLLGFAPADGQFHAPNEWMWMSNFETGIRTIARYWDEVARLKIR
ncbi:MAG: dipeptidase [Candidatus Limnocylindrales bacterium]|jgi:acetylornithine deacetylase/succinyl-diaminopimelate desuccinylase-like protein